jgi:hypothetical protein
LMIAGVSRKLIGMPDEIGQVRISTLARHVARKASFLNQGLLPEVDADGRETSECPSSVTSVKASKSRYDHTDFMSTTMTFDALWRANLAQDRRQTDTPKGQEMPGTQTRCKGHEGSRTYRQRSHLATTGWDQAVALQRK